MTTPRSTRQAGTQLLGEWSNGDEEALGKLFPLVHSELHQLAHHYMSRERTGVWHKLRSRFEGGYFNKILRALMGDEQRFERCSPNFPLRKKFCRSKKRQNRD